MGHLLSFLDEGPIHDPEYSGPRAKDIREFVDIVRRLTIPYYEEARLYWRRAQADGFFSGCGHVAIYQPDTLKLLIDTYGDESPGF